MAARQSLSPDHRADRVFGTYTQIYEEGAGYPSSLPDDVALPSGHDDLESFFSSTETTAFIVVQRDRLLYEHYFNGYDRDSTQTSFSVAKSFASALVGIAITDGVIALDDPITDYLPELRKPDARFEQVGWFKTSWQPRNGAGT